MAPAERPLLGVGSYLLFVTLGGVLGYWLVWWGGWGRLRREFGWGHPTEAADR
ncbi:hypothetical protein [Halogeometricum luteum]|uniref:Uncharacterized protein n=1 Tax=Halogeometricum luteum TaxID=2950537 RepID=A0ABU2G0L0_9EURY|nr:hypothetical protein [Halogeometricum sp. S3BR5-2]MDS0294021.1 hypothetical protein [Halogeometricum sp. S3BR5-2]